MADEALFGWVRASVPPELRPETLQDLQDGRATAALLLDVDTSFFTPLQDDAAPESQFDLVTRYFASQLDAPLPRSSSSNYKGIHHLVTLVLSLAVQSDKASNYVQAIQTLSESDQEILMKTIEQVTSTLQRRKRDGAPAGASLLSSPPLDNGDHESMEQLRTALKDVTDQRDKLQREHNTLHEDFNHLSRQHHELVLTHREAEQHKPINAAVQSPDLSRSFEDDEDEEEEEEEEGVAKAADSKRVRSHKNRMSSVASIPHDLSREYQAEVDRLRSELDTTANTLAEAESSNATTSSQVDHLKQQVEDLRAKANEADRLKDQVDELRHNSDKLAKSEAVIEKYKKKLEDGADMRRNLKALETQNASLVDANAALEEHNSTMKSYKPLLDQYKSKISSLEESVASSSRENEQLKYQLDETTAALRAAEEEKEQSDARQQELDFQTIGQELASRKTAGPSAGPRSVHDSAFNDSLSPETDDPNEEGNSAADDSFDTNTMTQLRQQVRSLQRQVASSSHAADNNRTLVLQNLLDDANRMKARYESDYLTEMRSKLKAESQLDEIRKGSGKDDAPATIALRLRLNETVEELEELKKKHSEVSQGLEKAEEELVVAKSNLHLVNQDQLSIVNELRASVSDETTALHSQIASVKSQLSSAEETRKMQSSQIQKLLLDKIELQGDSIGQRERMLARERDFTSLKQSATANGNSSDDSLQLLSEMEEQLKQAHQEVVELQEKLEKARTFIKQQDALAREKYTALGASATGSEQEAQHEARVRELEKELERALSATSDLKLQQRKEQSTMLANWQKMSLDRLNESHLSSSAGHHQSNSWLASQRAKINATFGR